MVPKLRTKCDILFFNLKFFTFINIKGARPLKPPDVFGETKMGGYGCGPELAAANVVLIFSIFIHYLFFLLTLRCIRVIARSRVGGGEMALLLGVCPGRS